MRYGHHPPVRDERRLPRDECTVPHDKRNHGTITGEHGPDGAVLLACPAQ